MPIAPVIHRYHVVLRGSGLEADGVQRERDEVLDTSEWRSTRALIDARKIAPLPYDVEPVTCPCGRSWLDQAAADIHTCPERPKAKAKAKPAAATKPAAEPETPS